MGSFSVPIDGAALATYQLWRGSVGVKGCSHVGPEFELAQQSVILGSFEEWILPAISP